MNNTVAILLPDDESEQLRKFIGRRVANTADIQDIHQETLLRLLTRTKDQSVENPLPYAYRVAQNLILDRYRRARHLTTSLTDDISSDAPSADDGLFAKQRLKILKDILSKMPALRRKVFLRRRLYGESYSEIAEKMNLSIRTVEKHVSRALTDLARGMQREEKPRSFLTLRSQQKGRDRP